MFIRIIIAIMDYSVKRLKVANWLSFVCAKIFRLSYRFPLVPGWLGSQASYNMINILEFIIER